MFAVFAAIAPASASGCASTIWRCMVTPVHVRDDWAPLLDGARADEATRVLSDIAEQLAPLAEGDGAPIDGTLAGGTAGLAVFFAELSLSGTPGADSLAVSALDKAIDAAVAMEHLLPSLYSGPIGVGWALAHLEQEGVVDADDDETDVDLLVHRMLETGTWGLSYDLIQGLVGIGTYCIRRLPREGARKGIRRVAELLTATAEHGPDGARWWTDPRWAGPERVHLFPKGYYDTGMAHGVSGVIAFLACAVSAGCDEARALLDSALAWLLSLRLPPSSASRYPLMFGPDEAPTGGKMAWCYGDLGVAVALHSAAEATADDSLGAEALATAVSCAARGLEDANRMDAVLCHGAAGHGHIFNLLWQRTGDERLRDAARSWMTVALRLRAPGDGLAGYRTFQSRAEKPSALPGVLDGAAGIGLALLAATGRRAPHWHQFMMLDPPRSAAA